MAEVFGFHCIDENLFSPNDYSFTETYYDAQNVLNVLGWIPVLGSFTGAARLGGTAVIWLGDEESHRTAHKKYFTVSAVRGVMEMCALGWLMIIPDVVCSLQLRRRTRNRVSRAAKQDRKRLSEEEKNDTESGSNLASDAFCA